MKKILSVVAISLAMVTFSLGTVYADGGHQGGGNFYVGGNTSSGLYGGAQGGNLYADKCAWDNVYASAPGVTLYGGDSVSNSFGINADRRGLGDVYTNGNTMFQADKTLLSTGSGSMVSVNAHNASAWGNVGANITMTKINTQNHYH